MAKQSNIKRHLLKQKRKKNEDLMEVSKSIWANFNFFQNYKMTKQTTPSARLSINPAGNWTLVTGKHVIRVFPAVIEVILYLFDYFESTIKTSNEASIVKITPL